MNIGEVDGSSVGHITLDLLPIVLFLAVQGNGSVEVVPTQAINQRLDWGERPLV